MVTFQFNIFTLQLSSNKHRMYCKWILTQIQLYNINSLLLRLYHRPIDKPNLKNNNFIPMFIACWFYFVYFSPISPSCFKHWFSWHIFSNIFPTAGFALSCPSSLIFQLVFLNRRFYLDNGNGYSVSVQKLQRRTFVRPALLENFKLSFLHNEMKVRSQFTRKKLKLNFVLKFKIMAGAHETLAVCRCTETSFNSDSALHYIR